MQTEIKIAVVGATGRLGRHVVDVLRAKGSRVVPISRSNGVDVISGKGLADALAGVECVIDAASSPSPDQEEATRFFTTATQNLQEEGVRAGVRRMVVVSIIGVDRVSTGYMAAKLVQERAAQSGKIPVHILRSAQFHEFVAPLVAWGRKGEVSYVPKVRSQLVAARTVAETLAELATPPASSGGLISEIAGPRVEDMVDAAKRLVVRRGEPVRVEGVIDSPVYPDRAVYESDALLPGPEATLAGPTFEEWLARDYKRT
jgi:uncharacterized protein YbjT (DUF2867 family)